MIIHCNWFILFITLFISSLLIFSYTLNFNKITLYKNTKYNEENQEKHKIFNKSLQNNQSFYYLNSIEQVVMEANKSLQLEMDNYDFPSNKKLTDYITGAGGKPLRIIIITTWRTGSTFLGDIFEMVPGMFYHYEPLADYKSQQIRNKENGRKPIARIRRLLNCNFNEMDDYILYMSRHPALFERNIRLLEQCEVFPHLCMNKDFLQKLCKLYPFQVLKVVRLRLSLVEQLLEDEELAIKVLHLVRDPRGVIQSRKYCEWCWKIKDCSDATVLCSDMFSDYESARRFKKLYPNRFQ